MPAKEHILVGDVGGTSVRFALAHYNESGIVIENFAKMPGDNFPGFDAAVAAYLKGSTARPRHALFALAGPVRGGEVHLTNRAWSVGEAALEEQFGFARAAIVNDFAAMARAVPELPDGTLEVISPGRAEPRGPILVAGAGTGYGVGVLLPDGQASWRVVSGEGGHAAYAPRTAREFALADWLAARYGYVSNELICSGMGLEAVHQGLCALSGDPYTPLSPADVLVQADKGDPICREICTLRARALMSSAGDAALTVGAVGGVVLAGGVSARLAPYLRATESLSRFRERGPQSTLMADIPIHLINHETAPLIGAAALYFEREDPHE